MPDMKNHFRIVKEFQQQYDTTGIDVTKGDDRLMALRMMMKISDTGHVLKSLPETVEWVKRINEEFFITVRC